MTEYVALLSDRGGREEGGEGEADITMHHSGTSVSVMILERCPYFRGLFVYKRDLRN